MNKENKNSNINNIFVSEEREIFLNDYAKNKLKIENDKKYLNSDGIIKVDKKRWEKAQKYEKLTWMQDSINANDDRNYDHLTNFNNYYFLNNNKFNEIIELGCGPFSNLRLIIPQLNSSPNITLLDPLIDEYLKHPNCSYKNGYLLNHKVNLIKSSIEDFATSKKFDLVVMINVLEHCFDIEKIFSKILEILTDDGILIFSDVYFRREVLNEIVEKQFDAGHPIRIIDKYILEKLENNFIPTYKKNFYGLYDQEYRTDIYFVGQKFKKKKVSPETIKQFFNSFEEIFNRNINDNFKANFFINDFEYQYDLDDQNAKELIAKYIQERINCENDSFQFISNLLNNLLQVNSQQLKDIVLNISQNLFKHKQEINEINKVITNFNSLFFVEVGQITQEQSLATELENLIKNIKPKVILDIGAAAGLGTTKVIANLILANNLDTKVYSIEIQEKIYSKLLENTKDFPFVFPLLGTIITSIEIPSWEKIQNDLSTWGKYLLHNYKLTEIKNWYNSSSFQIISAEKKNRLVLNQIEENKYDIVILNGGEFFGNNELKKIIHKADYIVLDDINSFKNSFNHFFLENSDDWELIKTSNERNGWSIFKRQSINNIKINYNNQNNRSKRKIHFVYSGNPENDNAITPPNSITNRVFRFLQKYFDVICYEFNDTMTEPIVKPDDIILGHPHPDNNTIMRKLVKQNAVAKILLWPFHSAIPSINRYVKDFVLFVDKLLMISGPLWIDNIEQTEFSEWKSKIVRLDNPIDLRYFKLIKKSFNPKNKRGFFILGRSGIEKGTTQLFKLMLNNNHKLLVAGDYSFDDLKILKNRPNIKIIGHLNWNDQNQISEILDETDFFINYSISDASPTTLFETMALGLIPVSTLGCGYDYDSIIHLNGDLYYDTKIIKQIQNYDEYNLKLLQKKNIDLLIKNHNWDLFLSKILETINALIIKDKSSHTNIKVASDYSHSNDLTKIDQKSDFSLLIKTIIKEKLLTKIIETGTYLGNGTTSIIASAIKENNINAKFYSIEINPNYYQKAIENLKENNLLDKVILLNGLSIPKNLLPDKQEIYKNTVNEIEYDNIFVDHYENERVDNYYRETDFPNIEDDILEICLREFNYQPDFILLDSGGHIGNIEFNYVINKLKSKCIIALDDTQHIKHHKSFIQIQNDSRFEIIASSNEKFGFCIAKFNPSLSFINSNPKKILFVRTDSIGDNILAASMLKPIKEKFDDAEIIMVCQNHIAELYSSCPYINQIISFDKKRLYEDETYKNDFLENLKLIKPDLVLNTVYSRESSTDIISLNCDAETTIAFIGDNSNLDEDERLKNNLKYSKLIQSEEKIKNELARYEDFLNALSIPYDKLEPQMWLSKEDEDFAEQFFNENNLSTQNTIALLPFAQFDYRIYEHYDKIINQFPDYNFIILGSKKFYEQSKFLEQKLNVNFFNLVGKTSVRQLAAIIKKSTLYFGAETSGAHIACAVGTPNVVLVGGGHFNRFFPYSNLTTTVCLPLECYQCNWDCKYEKSFCVKDIEPIIIVNALKNALKNKCQINSLPTIIVEGISYWLENYNQEKPDWIDIKKFVNPKEVNIIEINDKELLYKNLIKAAELEIDKNNYEQAKKYLDLVLESDNNNINALNDLAVLEIMNKNWEIAQNIIMKIIQIEPNNEIAKNNFIYLENKLTIHNAILESENLIAQEKYSESKNLLEGVLKNDSENIDALNNLSVVEISLGNYQSAEELIREILSIEPQNEIALNNFDYLNNLFQNENKEKNDKNSNLSEQSFKEENKISTESFVENSSQKKFKNKITIATSIAPKDLEKQKKAIQSWIEVGFDVISINIEEEIVKLEPEFTNVKFIKAQRDARNFAEKPYIYFDDVMEQLSLSGSEVCGIINSDIVLNVKKDFYDFIYNEAKNSFVFGSRVDIKNIDSSEGIFYEYGFDIFFFNRNVISLFPKSDFCLGLPWWDYWIIAIPLIKNIKLKKLISPVAFHLWHKTNYDIKYWKNYGQIFINYLIENNLSKIKNKFFSNYSLEEQNNIISFELLLLFSKKSNHLEFNRINKNIVIRTEALSETNLSPAQFIQSFFTNQRKNIHKINNHLIGQNIDNLIDKGLFQEAYLLLWNLFNSNPKNMIVIQYLTIISFIKKDFNQSTIFINLLKNKFNKNFTNDKIIDYYNNMLKQQDDENTKAIKNEIKEQKDEILVSAIVSVYNSEKFIKGCLEDLINQTLYKKGNLEIIIVNSGSKQNEEEIIIDYKNKYDNIVYIKTEERETIYQAWNRAIKIAKGKFITNANTDDRHSKIAFEKMLDAFQINPTLDVVYADDFMTNIPNDTFDSKTEKKIIKWSNFVKEFLLFGCFIGPHPMWKKSLHNKFGYFDESLNVVGDYEFWLRISQDANFYHLNEILGLYYFSENSVEHKNKKLTDEENQNVQKKYILKYITNFQQLNRIEILLEQIKNYSNLKDYYDLAKNLIKQRKNGLNLQSLIYNIITKFKNIFNPEVDNDLYNEKLIEVDNFIENDNFIIDEEVIQIYNKFKENFNILRTVKSEME